MLGMAAGVARALDDGVAGLVMLHDRAEDRGLHMFPGDVLGLGHGHEVMPEEYPGHPLDGEDAARERRFPRRVGDREIGGARAHNRLTGQKLERRWVGRRFGLDEHGPTFRWMPFDMLPGPGRVKVWSRSSRSAAPGHEYLDQRCYPLWRLLVRQMPEPLDRHQARVR